MYESYNKITFLKFMNIERMTQAIHNIDSFGIEEKDGD